MIERTLHPVEYLLILKRRKAWFVVPFLVCSIVGIALALLLPATYRSRATIAVGAPAVSPDLVPARASLNNDERIRALYQQLRSPAVLERVAREEGLAREQPIEQAAQELNERLDVELQKPVAGQPDLNAFHIVYDDSTPERAQRIANRVAQVFVDEHSRTREMQAEGTAEFLGTQLRTSQEKINQLEERLRVAKEQHMGKLPEQTMVNLQSVSGARQQLENTSNAIRLEQDRMSLVERQMQSMRQGAYAAPLGSPAQMRSPQQRVLELERELALARGKYTDKHPEIQLLEEDLKNARAEAAALRQQSRGHAQPAARGRPGLPAARTGEEPDRPADQSSAANRNAAAGGHHPLSARDRRRADGRTGAVRPAARVRARARELQEPLGAAFRLAGAGTDRAYPRRRTVQRA